MTLVLGDGEVKMFLSSTGYKIGVIGQPSQPHHAVLLSCLIIPCVVGKHPAVMHMAKLPCSHLRLMTLIKGASGVSGVPGIPIKEFPTRH